MGQTSGLHHLRRPGLCLALLGLFLLLPPGELATESGGIQPEVACPSCEDFNGCTADSCDTVYGTCRHTPVNCNDGNPCTSDFCTPGQFSTCQHTGLPTGTSCDDRNSCSISDVCNSLRQCRGTFLPLGSSCSDGNGCTASDTCREGGICRGDFLNAGDSCDDGSLCTSGETCVDEAGTLVCQGPTSCNDSNPCTLDTCDASTGLCAHPSVNCDDGNTCTTDACDPSTGSCTLTIISGCQEVACPPCDDFNACTVDSCDDFYGTCGHTPINCNDGNPCTSDSCTPGPNGTCQHTGLPTGTSCDDRNSCTIADVCNTSRQCRGTFLPLGSTCTDGNGCTRSDTCREGGICRGDFLNAGDSCDTSSPCTSGGTCVDEAGTLMCQGAARNCNDFNPCTQDSCVESTGLCAYTYVNCDDGNMCTDDACDPSTGSCTRRFRGGTCNDARACTFSDACSNGNCTGAPNCDDGVACTEDVCSNACAHLPHPERCDDGNPCSADICNGALGCQHQPIAGSCTPVNKCLAPVCNQGSCGGPPITCIDGDLCTNDGCNPSTGCVFTPNSCDDQDACTIESCNPQTGCAHTAVSCDDEIACTADTCDPQSGCAHDPNCDDGNPCTTDVCDAASGCSHLPVPGVPPSIQVSLVPNSLSPANHQMVPITATVSASGGCGGTLTIRLESITSSEPDDAAGSGDGNTRNDIQGAVYGTADFSFSLRAERTGQGPGRTYRVGYSATDALGATVTGSADVIVPR